MTVTCPPVEAQDLQSRHPGFRRLFAPGQLTLGLIMPLETYPHAPAPLMHRHLDMAARADAAGFSVLWMRDVPFHDPSYGDIGQVFDPLVYIGALATVTHSIALGTAGIVLPLREPKMLAKQVTSLDHLSNGRMILGLSSGDRPAEYPLFGIDFETRSERFRDAFDVYRVLTQQDFPRFASPRFGRSDGRLDLVPKPPFHRTPSLAIGRGQQSIGWIARNMDGFIAPSPALDLLPAFAAEWRKQVSDNCSADVFKPIGLAGYLDLSPDRDEPLQRIRAGFRAGSRALAEFLERARAAGINHAALNPKITDRPYADLMSDLERDVLPLFPSLTATTRP